MLVGASILQSLNRQTNFDLLKMINSIFEDITVSTSEIHRKV